MKTKSFFLFLAIILISSCNYHKEKNSNKASTSQDVKIKKAISWIENNLTSAHSLENHINRKNIPEIMSDYRVPGMSMVFVDQGEIIWKKAYGYANLSTLEKVTENTVFTGASLSKPLTTIAALKLVETKKLSLDDNVNTLLNGWQIPENEFTQEEKVTLRHLISHRAGIRNDLWSSYLPKQNVPSLIQMLSGQPPSVEPATSVISVPGSVEKYSNTGYTIIQKLIEDVTNKSFEKALDELVLIPSDMLDSSFKQPMPDNLQKKRAIGYDKNLEAFPYKLFPYKAAGGVWTTPSDMAKFILALFDDYEGKNRILSASMTRENFSRSNIRFAFSKIFDDKSDDLIFRHYGTNQGFSSYLLGSIQKRQAVVIMTNGHMQFEFLDYIARAVSEFYQWDYLQPIIHQPYKTNVSELNDYVGQFKINNENMKFTVINNVLTLNLSSSGISQNLTQIGPGEFISAENSIKYQFLKARQKSDGSFVWLRITSLGGSDTYAERIKQT